MSINEKVQLVVENFMEQLKSVTENEKFKNGGLFLTVCIPMDDGTVKNHVALCGSKDMLGATIATAIETNENIEDILKLGIKTIEIKKALFRDSEELLKKLMGEA